ncbi:hypothetical protein BDZ45DRAFT_220845 [Acephala macrosclerotiorum]|nr:hypothetical protein BDZ45DRAFT_220845 [Acephala macrosclerotiorum]
MSQLRFDTISHAGLHSYRFTGSAEGKLEDPLKYESDEDLDGEAMLRERLRGRLRERQEGSTWVQQAQKGMGAVDKATEDESRQRLYHEKKLRENRNRRPEKVRTYQAYVEDESSDPETYPGLRTTEKMAQRKLEKEIRDEAERESAIRAEAAEAARVELRAQNARDAARAQVMEAPMDPRWSGHRDIARAYMAAARRKIAIEAEDDSHHHPHPSIQRAETFQSPPSPQYNFRYATAPDYIDDDTPRRSSARSSSPIKEAPKHPKWAAHREFAAEYMRAARRKPRVETDDSELPHPSMRRSETYSAQPPQYEVRYATAPDYSGDDTPRQSSARTPRDHKQSDEDGGSDGVTIPKRSSTKPTPQYNIRYATAPQRYSDDDAPRRSSTSKKPSSSATPSSKPKKPRRKSSQLGYIRTKNQKEAKLVDLTAERLAGTARASEEPQCL